MENTQLLNIQIYDADSYGRGVGRHEGKVIFVPYTAPGDVVDCRVVHSEDRFDITELVRIVEPSERRVAPPCKYFGECPGCAFQHLEYELELEIKGKRIADCLKKFGGADIDEVTVEASPMKYGYRSHVTFHLWYNGRDTWCGLINPAKRNVIDLEQCMLLPTFARDLPGKVKKICAGLIGSYQGRFALRAPFVIDLKDRRIMFSPGRSHAQGAAHDARGAR